MLAVLVIPAADGERGVVVEGFDGDGGVDRDREPHGLHGGLLATRLDGGDAPRQPLAIVRRAALEHRRVLIGRRQVVLRREAQRHRLAHLDQRRHAQLLGECCAHPPASQHFFAVGIGHPARHLVDGELDFAHRSLFQEVRVKIVVVPRRTITILVRAIRRRLIHERLRRLVPVNDA